MTGRRRRFGVALLVPEPHTREVDALRRAAGDRSVRRVPPHVSLVPPVNVHRRDTSEAAALVEEAGARAAPLRLELGPTATFLPDNPVLYLRVGGEDLEALAALRDRVSRPPLRREARWPFVPHVTLRDGGSPEEVSAAAGAMRGYRAHVTFERLHLLVEHEGRWRPYSDVLLGGRRVVGRGGLELAVVESEHLDPEARALVEDQWRAHRERAGYRFDPRPFALTARREGETVGTATGWTNEGVAHLSGLVVAAHARDQGVGAQLLASFEDLAARRGCPRLSLRTPDAPHGARGFYERRGWWVEAAIDDWVGGDPVLQMRRDL